MTVKQYLGRAAYFKQQIKRTEERIAALQETMRSARAIRYDKDRVQASAGDPMLDYIEQLEDLRVQEAELQIKYTNAYNRIRAEIDELESPLQQTILTMRYLDGMSFRQIANRMNYSQRYMEKMHGRALQQFARLHRI